MTNYEKEIKDLHQFFEDYFVGRIPASAVTRFETSVAEGFHLVEASGKIINREEIIAMMHGGYRHRDNCKIWIENTQLRQQHGDLLIVSYEEWQTIDAITTSRTSTVVFRDDDTQPNGLIWLYVHESGLKDVDA
ncbi:MAG: hypothetical protein WBC91_00225 [Phototrophicaceae bacterium]